MMVKRLPPLSVGAMKLSETGQNVSSLKLKIDGFGKVLPLARATVCGSVGDGKGQAYPVLVVRDLKRESNYAPGHRL